MHLHDSFRCVSDNTSLTRVQGLQGKALQEEAETMIKDLQLQDKRDVASSHLSGGMKRKLRWATWELSMMVLWRYTMYYVHVRIVLENPPLGEHAL